MAASSQMQAGQAGASARGLVCFPFQEIISAELDLLYV